MASKFLRLAAMAAAAVTIAFSASAQSLIRDTEIEEILREWTDPILTVAGLNPSDVGFYIINDPTLNAFVANGQNIHIHTGLIIAADSPAQIKGVIAHETCHIACGHSVSRQRAASIASRPALVSIGLGILAIAAGEGGAGAALIGSSQQFAALNFFVHTRTEESMADAAAVQYLSELHESTGGIVSFFDKFRYQEVLSDARRYPYFRSHPLASDRIRAVRQLAEQSGLMDAPPTDREQMQYEMMRAKLIGFLDTPNKVNNEYPPGDDGDPAHYARSIAAMQASDIDVALREIAILIDREPDNPYFYELQGQILFESGRPAESVEPHRKSLELKPGAPLLLINYARSLNARDEPGDVEAAETALRDALIAEPENAFAWAQLAITLEKQDRRAEAQLATAESAYAIGDIVRANAFAHRAVDQLDRGTITYRRADDILLITDPSNPDNRQFYDRYNRAPRFSVQTNDRDMPFGNFASPGR
ncbi:M48 family metalloprotease [Hyphomonas johnsonii]|uniref:M48 family peptidase n=1 Tax=Hyphomonas johnsonii MHS-2 TaxID=1280950 RepID=A0A059FAI4_9PROT|nr:M48 family metalloprotease [Hyphomonas johnsonii]KCZ87612.1 M48 family peptidase [Hyphomonas johnsonii MHS-2]